ncbi:unnamed protein product [Arctia plantaginis]|uniref:Reverse transcriptase domain-containing protein n=1 Tax=Arctia plantaginis TaxID=874455 RepID=A0A8S0ZPT6_ARCPL|nr:unnamed protein product [Arctia plantaginis]
MPGFITTLARTNIDWDILVLTECWLPNTHNIPDLPGYNYFFTTSNLTQNEGVVVYVHKNLQCTVVEPPFLDANCLQVTINNNTSLLALYRPPGYRDATNFLASLNDILTRIDHFSDIVVAGDININIHEQCQDLVKHNYLNLLASHGLLPAHSLPTRQNACLDHIILKTRKPATTLVANSSLTDHDTVLLYLSTRISKIKTKKFVNRINYEQLDADFKRLDFSEVYKMLDPNDAAEIMINLIKNTIDLNSKIVKIPNRKQTIKPWITPGLLRCIRHRDKLNKKSKLAPNNDIIKLTFKRYKNYCNKLLKTIKMDYEKKQVEKAGNDTKQVWSVINNMTGRSKGKVNVSTRLLTTLTSPEASINFVNDYFSNIGKHLAEKNMTAQSGPAKPITANNSPHSMVLLPADEGEVARILRSLRDGCSTGVDGISSGILKKHELAVVSPLTYICNLVLSTGKFPKAFKKAIIHPIFKGGDGSRVNNYRPIAVLPVLSKIIERIMNNRLITYLEGNQLLSSIQFGFRAGKSTSDAVHELTDYIVTEMDGGQKVLGIFLDIAKAFDTVSVPNLMSKLESLGIRGVPLDLFKDYLSERTQRVRIGDYLSDERVLTYGTPQGSVIGPTLFLIYVNDIGMLTLPKGRAVMFADDTALVFSGNTWSEVYERAQSGFNIVSKWLRSNLLTLNNDKTHYITFSLKGNPSTSKAPPYTILAHTCPEPHRGQCPCTPLHKAHTVKYLGVIIDKNLGFHEHIDALNSRLRKLMYIFKTIRCVLDTQRLKAVYFALVQSVLTYCITIWGGAPKIRLIDLERTQRAILKVALCKPYRFPTALLYREAEVLTVRQLFILYTLLKQHSLLVYNQTPSSVKRRFNPVQRLKLLTKHSKRFFCHMGGFLYNKVNRVVPIFHLTKAMSKRTLTNYLKGLNYDDTEAMLSVIV